MLIPRLLNRNRFRAYLLSLFGCVGFIGLLLRGISLYLNHDGAPRLFLLPLFMTIFVLSISTTYRILTDFYRRQNQQKDEENARLRSELAFLRWQISPHFLYNVLNSIAALARMQSDQTEAVTHKLAELMRYLLQESNETQVPLERELEYLGAYIDLQTLRFGSKVRIEFDMQGVSGRHVIEPMLLIPFVENAFKHGVGRVQQPVVAVVIGTEGSQLRFWARNKLPSGDWAEKEDRTGIGLTNVRRRLNLLYPDRHTLTFGPQGEWFVVDLRINLN